MAEMEEKYRTDLEGNPYPLEDSESGKNAFYFSDCEVPGHTVAYCVCLKKIKDHNEGKLSLAHSDCGSAIDRNQCKAARLRREEKEVGHALYFISRKRLNDEYDAMRAAAGERMTALCMKKDKFNMPKSKSAASVEKKIDKTFAADTDADEGNDYAAAINAAISKTIAEKPKPEPESEPKAAPVPQKKPAAQAVPARGGMSLIEMARARMAANAAQ